MTNCLQCNKQNRLSAKFCSHCGVTLAAAAFTGQSRIRPGQLMAGKYTVVRELGRGGMGAVFLATQTIANKQRQVVIKEMLDYYDPHDPQAESKARQRFESEAGTLVTLNFAGIPQIFEYFSADGHNYIVMQFIEGRDLAEGLTYTEDDGTEIEGQPYPIGQVVQWGIQVCKVLENLEVQQVVHMDIKPANLILDRSGNVWLVDFGTAKAQWVTQTGGRVGLQKSSVYGTMGYAPPEQAAGKAETRSDVYALAATLYHLLTDKDPRDNPFQFPELNTLPTELANILNAALVQNVTHRLTAAQFRQRLTQYSTTELNTPHTQPQPLTPARPTPSKGRNPLMWIVGFFLVLFAAATLWNSVVEPSMRENFRQEAAATSTMLAQATGLALAQATETAEVQQTTTAQIVATSTAVAQKTATAQAEKTATAQAQQTATAQVVATKTARAQRTATARAQKTATAQARATATAQAHADFVSTIEASRNRQFGPEDGRLVHDDDEFIEIGSASVELRDFVVEATFSNPYPTSTSSWDYGFLFRDGGGNEQFRLIIQSKKTFVLENWPEKIGLSSGEIPNLNVRATDSNKIKIISKKDRGLLYINNDFIAELDLSARSNSGGIFIATGMHEGDEIDGEATGYKDFTVWSIP